MERVGGGAEADIGVAGPVGAVVDGLAARQGPVGDLVVDVAGGAQRVAELAVLRRAALDEESGDLVYIELRNAIEQLGGEAPERSFSDDDPEYESLKDLER